MIPGMVCFDHREITVVLSCSDCRRVSYMPGDEFLRNMRMDREIHDPFLCPCGVGVDPVQVAINPTLVGLRLHGYLQNKKDQKE